MSRAGSSLRRLLLASAISLTGLIVASPTPADAAMKIGQTFTPDVSFTGSGVFIQAGAPNGSYLVPSDGVITSWSFQAPANPTPPMKLKMFRPEGGTDYTTVGDSELVTPTAGVLNTFMTRIPVKAGDVPGHFYSDTTRSFRFAAAAYSTLCCQSGGDPPPGTTRNYVPDNGDQIDLSAVLEPDANRNGFGDQTQECGGKAATVVGTNAADKLSGTSGADVIAAGDGNDKVSGLAGNDLICGGAGKDTLKGGKGKDTLRGQKGNDKLEGGGGNDKLSGKKGKDKLTGGGGKDTLKGAGGKDVCIGGKANDTASKCEVEKSI